MGRKKETKKKKQPKLLNRAVLMARTQMSFCTLTFIVWGRRELLTKRDKNSQQRPGVAPTLGLSRACQRVQRACLCSAAGDSRSWVLRQHWSQHDCDGDRDWRSRKGSHPARAPEADVVPKENRPRWCGQVRRAEGRGKMLLWGPALGQTCSGASLSPTQGVWAGQGGGSLTWDPAPSPACGVQHQLGVSF